MQPLIRGVAVFVLASLATAMQLAPVRAESLPNVISLEMADHPENSGNLIVEYHDHAQITQWQQTRSEIYLQVADEAGNSFGPLWFYLPAGVLGVGTYPDTVYPNVDSGRPGMMVWWGCSYQPAGSFTIDDIAWDGTTLTTLSLSFRCVSPDHAPVAGELRINSDRPLRAHDAVPHALDFGRVDAGASAMQDAMLSNIGTGTITPGAVHLGGLDAADFEVVDDRCADARIAPGGQCIVRVRFHPRDGPSLTRTAILSIADDTAMGYVDIELKGLVRRPTTTTVTSIVNPGLQGVTLTATVDPPAARGTLEWLVDGTVVSTATFSGPAVTFTPGIIGTHTILARFLGSAGYAPSDSGTRAQVFTTETWINLYVRPIQGAPDGTVAIEANLYADHTHGYGGVLRLWDETTGVEFATVGTSQILGATSAYIPNVTLLGHHVIRASYSGIPPYVLGSDATVAFDGPPIVVGPDVTPPRVSGIGVSLGKGSQLSGTNVPVRLAWSGTDNVAVARYEIQRRVDGGLFGGTVTSTTPSLSSTVASGHTTSFRIRARDVAGNVGAWQTSSALSPRTYQEPTARLPWVRYTSASASSGAAIRTSRTGATVSMTFAGRGFALVAPTSLTRGRATLILDGKTIGTVDLASYRAGSRRLVYTRTLTNGNHRLVIRVNGTGGRPRVDLDALIVLR